MAVPGNTSEQFKSFLYLLSGILFVLVLLDKGINKKNISEAEMAHPKGFKNIGKNFVDKIETVRQDKNEKVENPSSEKLSVNDETEISEDSSIPLFEEPDEPASKNIESLYVYFLKFYGKGNKSHSRLARVARESGESTQKNIEIILNELIKGPNAEEKEKGILNAIPSKLLYSKDFVIQDGILRINLNDEFGYGAGPEILKDRIDQLTYSLLQIPEIRGISISIGNKKIHSLGGDGVPIPPVLVRNQRKVMYF